MPETGDGFQEPIPSKRPAPGSNLGTDPKDDGFGGDGFGNDDGFGGDGDGMDSPLFDDNGVNKINSDKFPAESTDATVPASAPATGSEAGSDSNSAGDSGFGDAEFDDDFDASPVKKSGGDLDTDVEFGAGASLTQPLNLDNQVAWKSTVKRQRSLVVRKPVHPTTTRWISVPRSLSVVR